MISLEWTESTTKASMIEKYQLWRSTALDPDAANFLRTFTLLEEFVVERDTFGAISNSDELYSWVDEELVATPEAPQHFYILAIPVQGPSARSNVLTFTAESEPEPAAVTQLGDFEFFRHLINIGESNLHGAHTLQDGTSERLVIVPFVAYPVAVPQALDLVFEYGGTAMNIDSVTTIDLGGVADVVIGFAYLYGPDVDALTPGELDLVVSRPGGPTPDELIVATWIGSFDGVPSGDPTFTAASGGEVEAAGGALILTITGSEYATSPAPFHLTFSAGEAPAFDPETTDEFTTYGELEEAVDTEGLAWAVGLSANQQIVWSAIEGHNGLSAAITFGPT